MVKTTTNRRLVQIGRVAVKTSGKDAGSTGTIVNIIDQNRVLIDGTGSKQGLRRQVANLRDIEITPLHQVVQFNSGSKAVAEATKKSGVDAKWHESAWAKKIAVRAARKTMTDFERFQLRRIKRQRNALVRAAFHSKKN
mgnify:CR=1 FL=1